MAKYFRPQTPTSAPTATDLSAARRRLETNLRINAQGYFRPWVESYLGDGWKPAPPPAGTFLEGEPSQLWREKPSPNGNGWWAGDKLVHQYATPEEAEEALRKARRRIEDRLRKEPAFLAAALRGEYWAAPGPDWGNFPSPPPQLVDCGVWMTPEDHAREAAARLEEERERLIAAFPFLDCPSPIGGEPDLIRHFRRVEEKPLAEALVIVPSSIICQCAGAPLDEEHAVALVPVKEGDREILVPLDSKVEFGSQLLGRARTGPVLPIGEQLQKVKRSRDVIVLLSERRPGPDAFRVMTIFT